MSHPEPDAFTLPLVWVGLDDVPIQLANALVSQFSGPDGFVVSVGQVAPPVILGTPEERRDQVGQVRFVPVRPLARLSLSPARLKEFIGILQENLAMFERQVQAGEAAAE